MFPGFWSRVQSPPSKSWWETTCWWHWFNAHWFKQPWWLFSFKMFDFKPLCFICSYVWI